MGSTNNNNILTFLRMWECCYSSRRMTQIPPKSLRQDLGAVLKVSPREIHWFIGLLISWLLDSHRHHKLPFLFLPTKVFSKLREGASLDLFKHLRQLTADDSGNITESNFQFFQSFDDPMGRLKKNYRAFFLFQTLEQGLPPLFLWQKSEEKKLVGRESADGENGGQSGRARNWDNTDSDVRHQRMPRCRTSWRKRLGASVLIMLNQEKFDTILKLCYISNIITSS